MRGSPILRTLLVALALIAAGFGLTCLDRRPPAAPVTPVAVPAETRSIPFFLTLSHLADEIRIESAGGLAEITGEGRQRRGVVELDPAHPALFVTIRWRDSAAQPRFAKLRLEPPGRSDLSHTFDAIGDLEDVWEPVLSSE